MFSRFFWVLILLWVMGLAYCADIPLELNWDSANSFYYAPPQTNKSVSWSEFYRAEIALDSLYINDVYASFLIQNHADFLDNQLKLHSFELGYTKGTWQISGATEPIGYGAKSTLNPNHLISPDMDDFPYQATRFNRIKLSKSYRQSSISLALGGSVHNQAIGYAQWTYFGIKPAFTVSLKQEARGQDNHWRSPVSISSLNVSFQNELLRMNVESAYSYFFEMNKTHGHESVYALGEVDISVFDNYNIFALAELKQLEPGSESIQRYQGAVSTSFGQMVFSPGVLYNVLENTAYAKGYLSADYMINHSMRVGLIYGYEGSKIRSGKHSLSLQSSLTYDL